MFCPKCGKESSEQARFCQQCGINLPFEPSPSPPKSTKHKSSVNVSWKPLAFFFGGLLIGIGKHIERQCNFSNPIGAGITTGLLVAIFCFIGWGLAYLIVKKINEMNKLREYKVKLAWTTSAIGLFLYFLIFGLIGHNARGALYWGIREMVPSQVLQIPGVLLSRVVPMPPSMLVGISTGLILGFAEYDRSAEKAKEGTIFDNSRKSASVTPPPAQQPREADWKLYGRDAYGDYYYNAGEIAWPSKNIARVWEKRVWTEQTRRKWLELTGQDRGNYRILLTEINFPNKMARLLQETCYSKEGVILDFSDTPQEWQSITPDSPDDWLYKTINK